MVDSASRTPKILRGIAPPDNKSFNPISLQKNVKCLHEGYCYNKERWHGRCIPSNFYCELGQWYYHFYRVGFWIFYIQLTVLMQRWPGHTMYHIKLKLHVMNFTLRNSFGIFYVIRIYLMRFKSHSVPGRVLIPRGRVIRFSRSKSHVV